MAAGEIVATILSLGMLTIVILSFIGLGYLTKFAFNSTSDAEGNRTVQLTDTEVNLAKMTVVLQWIAIGWAILSVIVKLAMGQSQPRY